MGEQPLECGRLIGWQNKVFVILVQRGWWNPPQFPVMISKSPESRAFLLSLIFAWLSILGSQITRFNHDRLEYIRLSFCCRGLSLDPYLKQPTSNMLTTSHLVNGREEEGSLKGVSSAGLLGDSSPG